MSQTLRRRADPQQQVDWFCFCLVEKVTNGNTEMKEDYSMNITGRNYKKPLVFAAALLPAAVIGGLFTGIYTYEGYTAEIQQLLLTQLGGYMQYLMVIALQTIMYAAVCGFFGYILADKTGLLKSFTFEKNKLMPAGFLAVVCGVVYGLDYWIFGGHIPEAAEACRNITYSNMIASVLYGGVVEEVMLRLFAMSLISLLLWKLFYRALPKQNIPVSVFIIANIVSALLFAAGHLPATFLTFQTVDAIVIIRCFLYNGGLGLVFGWLFRKYGIQYAMLGHAGTHIISKLIWLLLI